MTTSTNREMVSRKKKVVGMFTMLIFLPCFESPCLHSPKIFRQFCCLEEIIVFSSENEESVHGGSATIVFEQEHVMVSIPMCVENIHLYPLRLMYLHSMSLGLSATDTTWMIMHLDHFMIT
jgi:hypothetical protein